MNYFDQIIEGCETNIFSLLGKDSANLNEIAKRGLFKRNVEIINLELSYQCNRKCDYCPVSTSSRMNKQTYISDDVFERICRDLAIIRYENRISLNLYNEPLLDATLEEKIHALKSVLPFCHIQLNSNWDKLTAERLTKLVTAGLNSMCITLHPPANKSQSIETIKNRVLKLCARFGDPQLPDLDNAIFSGYLTIRHSGVSIRLQWPNWRIDGTDRAGLLLNQAGAVKLRTQPCAKPFREFTIFYDGTVQPCCESFHDDNINLVPVGNLHENSIFDVYSSDILSKFRKSVFDFGPKGGICATCSVADFSSPRDDVKRKAILLRLNVPSHHEN
jgi:MoaA/NifB/PqqE/SkfB family radical SAM enzyme